VLTGINSQYQNWNRAGLDIRSQGDAMALNLWKVEGNIQQPKNLFCVPFSFFFSGAVSLQKGIMEYIMCVSERYQPV
jgi:hypothetical protein